MNVPVAGLAVQQNIVAVGLVLRQVKTPDVPVILDQNLNGRIACAAGRKCEKVPHEARFFPFARFCELKFEKKMVTLRGRAVLKS